MSRDDATLLDILKACQLALDFAANMDRAAFLADIETTDVPRLLETLARLAPKPRA